MDEEPGENMKRAAKQERCFKRTLLIATIITIVIIIAFFVGLWLYESSLSEAEIEAAISSIPIEPCSMYCPSQMIAMMGFIFGIPLALYGVWWVCGLPDVFRGE